MASLEYGTAATGNGTAAAGNGTSGARELRRQTRERRAERWRRRLPLLDEDPTEEELSRWPPGEEEGAPPATLTPLGERLVGLVEWEADGVVRTATRRGSAAGKVEL